MRFGVLGTGRVGQALAGKLVAVGHEVTMGSRDAANEAAASWVAQTGGGAAAGTFAGAAAFAEVVINATSGLHSLEALAAAGSANLAGKVLIDVANPLDFSKGFPPSITHRGDDSLGEQIQRAFPDTLVVKTLNTVNCQVMIEPSLAPGGIVFVGGNHPSAKRRTRDMLLSFGWPDNDIVDCGDITSARAFEAYVVLWTRLMQVLTTPQFNIRIVRGA